ncbi:flavin-binding monooxygenase-like protein 1 [Elsinoe australis]|uniref:Flavin-binding monooxygenase-like protein 1 n=1 Tax=Elsinoe australis TaxID=40998 RepID=A0A4U7BEF1_9PEZI|nr:flavin-binding monooxygenase-like protein 1 [Elsinoe australis]
MASVDFDVLIIGAGSSGVGLAIQLQRKLGHDNYVLIEKSNDVGGTWLANTYPGCGCDVGSHFYSYSFALNPSWSRKFSMQPEIHSYFRSLALQYKLLPKIRFHSTVAQAVWQEDTQTWLVTITNHQTNYTYTLRARAVISGVGSLSVPRNCEVPGHESFRGSLFHSAQWDNSFDWTDKDVVVLGNGCSATQFVPIISRSGSSKFPSSGPAKKVTQFSRQAHYLAERENPYYSSAFKAVMRYVPLAMRFYRFKLYYDMEKDFAGFYTKSGKGIRDQLAVENEQYVKKTAPSKYWDYLIPKHEIGCKRKVLDTDYLTCLWKDNMELVPDDPVDHIEEHGVVTKSGRFVKADAIALATGFQTEKLLFPMKIVGEGGISLEDHWNRTTDGSPAAYMGTMTSGFPNFFILMGPNTVTGHLSVIYTVECQMLLTLALLKPILSASKTRLLPSLSKEKPTTVYVTNEAATRDVNNTHNMLKDFVWSSGCTSWALDPKTGTNIAMYPHYQWNFWLRTLFLNSNDFRYTMARSNGEKGLRKVGERKFIVGFGWLYLRRSMLATLVTVAILWVYKESVRRRLTVDDGLRIVKEGVQYAKDLVGNAFR